MYYERDIDTIFEKMSNEKQGQLIDAINDVLCDGRLELYIKENVNNKELKEFLNEYVRTDDEVFEEDLNIMEIRCPIEFLDKDAIIESDNDYEWLMDNLHLNTFCIESDWYDDDDENIASKILIKYNK